MSSEQPPERLAVLMETMPDGRQIAHGPMPYEKANAIADDGND